MVGKAEKTSSVVGVPMAWGLGFTDLLKRTFEEAWKDHLDAFAGNLTYKGLFALFPFSVLFALYVNNFGSYNATYGSLADVVIFLFYIYWSALIMLIGAEMNQVVEEHIPKGKDEGEKTIDADQ